MSNFIKGRNKFIFISWSNIIRDHMVYLQLYHAHWILGQYAVCMAHLNLVLLCKSKYREHYNYFWNVIVLRGKSQSEARWKNGKMQR